MTEVHLSSFNTGNFNKGAGFIKQTLWYFVNALFVRASWNPFMGIKVFFLKLFGAKIGKGLVIKNNVNIKFPWKLTLGNDVWFCLLYTSYMMLFRYCGTFFHNQIWSAIRQIIKI